MHITVHEFCATTPRRHNDVVFKNPKILSPFSYQDPLIKTAIHLAKYRGRKNVCRLLGEALWDIYGEDLLSHALLSGSSWTVVPIPLSFKKRCERGYNQTEELAAGFLAHTDSSTCTLATELLSRTPTHENQARTLSKKERLKNVSGSFFVSTPKNLRSHTILLLDDVVTTGATLREAARVLRKEGARHILCITVAH